MRLTWALKVQGKLSARQQVSESVSTTLPYLGHMYLDKYIPTYMYDSYFMLTTWHSSKRDTPTSRAGIVDGSM